MRKIAVIGAGKIGSTIASLLAGSGDYEVLVIDRSAERPGRLDARRVRAPPPWPSTTPARPGRRARAAASPWSTPRPIT